MNTDDVLAALQEYKRDCGEKYGILKIGIFGSMARGEANIASDIDICIKTKTANPFNLVHIRNDLEKLLGKHVDIVRIRETMNPFLKERIENEGRYV